MDKQERKRIVYRIGDLIEQKCQGCEHNGGQKDTTKSYCHTHCSVGKELLALGKRLDEGGNNVPTVTERKKKLTLELYQELKAKGMLDKEIAKHVKCTPTYVSNLKNEWGIRPKLKKAKIKDEHIEEIKKEVEKPSDRLEEMKQILSEKKHLISVQKAKIDELEGRLKSRKAFYEKELDKYANLNNDLQTQNARYYDEIVSLDQQHENDKKALETAKKTLELYTQENNAFRTLLRMWL